MKATVNIKKLDGTKIVVESAIITRVASEAQRIADVALHLSGLTTDDIKIAEYTVDGEHVFAYLRQHDGLHILTPAVTG